ncbi:hypothetical protein PVK06_030509 [Gossypium arboreum]|uniref:Uncharacterized protein n=1 Tax=Gossypium arboreum TaxID=29729 RepID=A0ABR0NR10_GOSAR|nr:hypothetical protein PVK06_030509 [Gossypium arboreum]
MVGSILYSPKKEERSRNTQGCPKQHMQRIMDEKGILRFSSLSSLTQNVSIFKSVKEYTPGDDVKATPRKRCGMHFGGPQSLVYYASMPTSMPTQMFTLVPTPMSTSMSSSMLISIPTSMLIYPSFTTSYGCLTIMSQAPIVSLYYQSGSSSQPPSHRMDDTQWKARMTPYSSMEEDDGDKDEDKGRDEDKYEG